MEEVAFPRGSNKKYSNDGGTPAAKGKKKEDELFKVSGSVTSKKKGKRKKKSLGSDNRSKKKQKMDGSIDVDSRAIDPINGEMIAPGMLILGCIKCVQKYGMVINLPGLLLGKVSIADISDSYTELLMKYTENESEESSDKQDASYLSEMYAVGSYVVCKVKEIDFEGTSDQRIVLTLNPRHLHEDITPSMLYNGMLLTAAVVSVEDHGYVMDAGIAGVPAFLKFSKTRLGNSDKGRHVQIGQSMLCVVDMPETKFPVEKMSALLLTSHPKAVSQAMAPNEAINIRAVLPGTLLSAKVAKTKENGLCVDCMNYQGVVLKNHLQDPFQTPTSYELNTEVKGRVLCIHPLTKVLYIALQKELLRLFPVQHFGGLRVGEKISEAEVVEVVKGNVLFRLRRGVRGVAPPSTLAVHRAELETKFSLGSVHRCVVKQLKWMDNTVMVSLHPRDVAKAGIFVEDLKPGDTVACTVTDCQNGGVGVIIADTIQGFIPKLFVDDKPVDKLLMPKMFKVGDELSCRVLKVNLPSKLVILTSKPSMVNSKLPILASYEDACVNMIVQGCVTFVKEGYLLVRFYNLVEGYLPLAEIIQEPRMVAYPLGHPVTCMVTECIPSEKRLRLTMQIPASSSAEGVKFPVGEIVSCEITEIVNDGLIVEIRPLAIKALLPTLHLSDYVSNCESIRQSFAPGDVIHKVLCFSGAYHPKIVTMKKTFIDWVEKGEAICDMGSIKLGMNIPLSVRNIACFGIFANLLHDMKALIHVKDISAAFVRNANDCDVETHQTLIGKVTFVDEAQQRIMCCIALPLQESIDGQDVTYLENFLREQQQIRNKFALHERGELRVLASHSVGLVTDFVVQIVNEHGAIGIVKTGIRAFVTREHMGKMDVAVGQVITSMVLSLDFGDCTLELLVDPEIIERVAKNPKMDLNEGPSRQNTTCTVLLVKPDYILVLAVNNGRTAFGYIPSKTHFNDILKPTFIHKYCDSMNIDTKSVIDNAIVGVRAAETRKTDPPKVNRTKAKKIAPAGFVTLAAKNQAILKLEKLNQKLVTKESPSTLGMVALMPPNPGKRSEDSPKSVATTSSPKSSRKTQRYKGLQNKIASLEAKLKEIDGGTPGESAYTPDAKKLDRKMRPCVLTAKIAKLEVILASKISKKSEGSFQEVADTLNVRKPESIERNVSLEVNGENVKGTPKKLASTPGTKDFDSVKRNVASNVKPGENGCGTPKKIAKTPDTVKSNSVKRNVAVEVNGENVKGTPKKLARTPGTKNSDSVKRSVASNVKPGKNGCGTPKKIAKTPDTVKSNSVNRNSVRIAKLEALLARKMAKKSKGAFQEVADTLNISESESIERNTPSTSGCEENEEDTPVKVAKMSWSTNVLRKRLKLGNSKLPKRVRKQ